MSLSTLVAFLVIDPVTDTIVKSQGFDESTFVVNTPATQWTCALDTDVASVDSEEVQPVAQHLGQTRIALADQTAENTFAAALTDFAGAAAAGTRQVTLTIHRLGR